MSNAILFLSGAVLFAVATASMQPPERSIWKRILVSESAYVGVVLLIAGYS